MEEVSGPYEGLQPAEVWRHFATLNAIPRPSGREAEARAYVAQVAAAHGAEAVTDARGNLVIRVPAGPAVAGREVVAVQGHLDMVCEQPPGSSHNFLTDPIRARRDDGRIYACDTTLGADNGIGVAMMLALITTPNPRRGPLELIFTVEEETGLHGAMQLDTSLLHATTLINLDSEDPDELTIGCAGGAGTILYLPVAMQRLEPRSVGLTLRVGGLKGGHSGVEIHQRLANAIKLLARVIAQVCRTHPDVVVCDMRGGSAHNAIPRDATALLAVAPDAVAGIQAAVAAADIGAEWAGDEPGLTIDLTEAVLPQDGWTRPTRDSALQLLAALPHGVIEWAETPRRGVESSSNLASVGMVEGRLEIGTSSRSAIKAKLQEVQEQIGQVGAANGASMVVDEGYPGWQPEPYSRVLQLAREAFRRVYGKEPLVQVVHAGLECGVILDRKSGVEAISFGPLIKGAHTPREFVEITSVQSTWMLLLDLLAGLCEAPAQAQGRSE